MKYALGTVQLGLEYGIANTTGKPSLKKSFEILDHGYDIGIDYLDTAIAYGDSEEILGLWRKKSKKEIPIITKIAQLDPKKNLRDDVRSIVYSSLKRLSIDCLHGILLHNFDLFEDKGPDIFLELESLKKEGHLKNIGISLYDEKQLKIIEKIGSDISIIQGGVNVFDHDFSRRENIYLYDLFARSIFLQGLLFLSEKDAEKKVKGSGVYIRQLNNISNEFNIPIPELAMRFVTSHNHIHSVVIGAENVVQLNDSFNLFNLDKLPSELIQRIESIFSNIPYEIKKPNCWRM